MGENTSNYARAMTPNEIKEKHRLSVGDSVAGWVRTTMFLEFRREYLVNNPDASDDDVRAEFRNHIHTSQNILDDMIRGEEVPIEDLEKVVSLFNSISKICLRDPERKVPLDLYIH